MIRIAIADDHKLFAKGIEGILEDEHDLTVVGVFPNGKELCDYISENPVDIVLTDLNMPIMDGFGVLNYCKEIHPDFKVVILSMYDEEKIYKQCIDQRADAFILKDADPDELIFTIHEVFEGRHVLNFDRVKKQALQGAYFDAFRVKYKLSRRETEIIHLIKDGIQNKEIALMLNLSKQTVETHRKNIHQKLQVSSRIELVNKAHEMNLYP
ncbi:LuxR family two component transcriptional regulator [Algoriphagus ratkowskyi]|uniref:LuxR family two component transcriptional regulator n=1 Tax=Algoriphagus ratkowskyi TaxID=57028 RepID=A0A2W7R172_9BACT|nr:response regulator transcription factor [Algoriphagus ratkowskyi]PZX54583.1 LuxR family two component transcriptional regulator [Algoriphagus ratkowskyi]TXD76899.1 response regulator transcription factor [Algoriphagus ratkowskyi]